MVKNAKIRNIQMRHFWVIFKQGTFIILFFVSFFRFPKPQDEAWFLVLGNVEDNGDLLALKRVNTVRRPTTQQLSFWTPEKPGRMILTLYVMSDSYVGLDQQYDIHLEVL